MRAGFRGSHRDRGCRAASPLHKGALQVSAGYQVSMARHPARHDGEGTAVALLAKVAPELQTIVVPDSQLPGQMRDVGIQDAGFRRRLGPFRKDIGFEKAGYRPPLASPTNSSSEVKRRVRRAYGAIAGESRSVKMRRRHSASSQRNRRTRIRIFTETPLHGTSAILRT